MQDFIQYLKEHWSNECSESLYYEDGSIELVLDRLDSGDVESLEDTASLYGYTLWSIVADYRGRPMLNLLFVPVETE